MTNHTVSAPPLGFQAVRNTPNINAGSWGDARKPNKQRAGRTFSSVVGFHGPLHFPPAPRAVPKTCKQEASMLDNRTKANPQASAGELIGKAAVVTGSPSGNGL